MLVRIAKYFLEQFTFSGELSIEQRTKILDDRTIIVFPCNIPDGIVNGYTNNVFVNFEVFDIFILKKEGI